MNQKIGLQLIQSQSLEYLQRSGPSGERCDSCYYWDYAEETTNNAIEEHYIDEGEEFGQCLHSPPALLRAAGSGRHLDNDWAHPLRWGCEWCGQWKKKDDHTAPESAPPPAPQPEPQSEPEELERDEDRLPYREFRRPEYHRMTDELDGCDRFRGGEARELYKRLRYRKRVEDFIAVCLDRVTEAYQQLDLTATHSGRHAGAIRVMVEARYKRWFLYPFFHADRLVTEESLRQQYRTRPHLVSVLAFTLKTANPEAPTTDPIRKVLAHLEEVGDKT